MPAKKINTIHPLREGIIIGLLVWLTAGVGILGIYNWTREALIHDVRNDLEQFAKIAAPLVDGERHRQLNSPAQANSELHRTLLAPLIRFHRTIPAVAYVYTCINVSNTVRFVLDTSTSARELNQRRTYQPSQIMDVYKSPDAAMLRALKLGVVDSTGEPYSDEFGTFMSGYAPFFDAEGKLAGIVGVDLSLEDYEARVQAVQRVVAFSFSGLTGLAALIGFLVYRIRKRAQEVERQHQQAEQAQRDQQRILRAVVDLAPIGIWLINAAGKPLFVNRAFSSAVGISEAKFLTVAHYAELFDAATAKSCTTSDQAALQQSAPHVSYETLPFVDGQLHKLEIIKVRLLDDKGVPTGVIGLSIDVTERDRVQAALQESEQRYRSLLAVSPDTIFIHRADKIAYINPAGERLFGARQPAELLQRASLDCFYPDTRPVIQTHLRSLLARQKTSGIVEGKIVRLDGIAVDVEIAAAAFTDQGAPAIQFILRDITYRKKLEHELRQSQKMEAIGTLAGGIAHDFNNLLAVIQASAEMAQTEGDISPGAAEYLHQISDASTRAAALTQQLLTFSRKSQVILQPVDLNELISKLVKMLRRLIREDIELMCQYSSEPISLLADPAMLDQILLNLTVNARDAMPRGGQLTIRAERVEINADYKRSNPAARAGAFAKLTVTDNGTGIAPEHLARIFDPFFTTKDVGKGTGLGLATVHGIVEQHQGWIEVSSQLGSGTTFQVFLPSHKNAPSENLAATNPTAFPGGTETILLVEDEVSLLKLVSRILRRHGYQVLEARDGIMAKEIWQQQSTKIDLLLTDIVMPQGVSGVELATNLHHERPALKILLTSGYSHENSSKTPPPNSPWPILAKPCPPRRLLETIRQCLDT
jgi:hypothetical protein